MRNNDVTLTRIIIIIIVSSSSRGCLLMMSGAQQEMVVIQASRRPVSVCRLRGEGRDGSVKDFRNRYNIDTKFSYDITNHDVDIDATFCLSQFSFDIESTAAVRHRKVCRYYSDQIIITLDENSAIAEMAAQSCTIRIFAIMYGVPHSNFNALYLSNL